LRLTLTAAKVSGIGRKPQEFVVEANFESLGGATSAELARPVGDSAEAFLAQEIDPRFSLKDTPVTGEGAIASSATGTR
jgi:hypothetical protein